MYNNNLIQIIQSFKKKEMTRFVEFAASPYHNKHKDTRKLIEYLGTIFPNFTQAKCDRKLIFVAIFGNKKHDQNELALVFTYALKLMEAFLFQEAIEENPSFQHILVLRKLREKNQFAYYEKVSRKLTKLQNKNPFKDIDFYNLEFLKATEMDLYYSQLSQYKKDLSIQEKEDNLDVYYFSVKLKDACEMVVRSHILNVDFKPGLLRPMLEEVENNIEKYNAIPSIIVYYKVYQLITTKNSDFYYDLINVMEINGAYFPLTEQQFLYNFLQNFCIEQINKGVGLFMKNLFELYKILLNKEILIDDDFLSEWRYKNIVTVGLRLKEMDWVLNFIEKYKDRLEPSCKENAYRFNLANFYYSNNELEKVLSLLVQVEYSDLRYLLGSKSILLRTYYSLGEYDALVSLADAFKQYVQRNKLMSDFRRNGFFNLVKFTKRSFQIKNKLSFTSKEKIQKEIEKLKKDIEESGTIFNKGWLLEKVNEL